MGKNTLAWLFGVLAFLVLALLIVTHNPQGLSKEDVKLVVSSELGKLNLSSPEYPDYTLSKQEYEDQATEQKALELASLELESKDFKEAVYDALVSYGEDIEDYKDITEFVIVDSDVDGDEVSYELKVFYFVDGDESEAYKARLDEFVIEVNDLDYEDQFEDAEVDESYLSTLSVKKVYD